MKLLRARAGYPRANRSPHACAVTRQAQVSHNDIHWTETILTRPGRDTARIKAISTCEGPSQVRDATRGLWLTRTPPPEKGVRAWFTPRIHDPRTRARPNTRKRASNRPRTAPVRQARTRRGPCVRARKASTPLEHFWITAQIWNRTMRQKHHSGLEHTCMLSGTVPLDGLCRVQNDLLPSATSPAAAASHRHPKDARARRFMEKERNANGKEGGARCAGQARRRAKGGGGGGGSGGGSTGRRDQRRKEVGRGAGARAAPAKPGDAPRAAAAAAAALERRRQRRKEAGRSPGPRGPA